MAADGAHANLFTDVARAFQRATERAPGELAGANPAPAFHVAIPKFTIRSFKRGESLPETPAPLSPANPYTLDIRCDEAKPSCVCNLPAPGDATALMAACNLCHRTALVPLLAGRGAPGAVRVDCGARRISSPTRTI